LAGQSLGKWDGSKCDVEESSPMHEVKAVKLFMVMTEGGFEKKIEVLCKKTDQHQREHSWLELQT